MSGTALGEIDLNFDDPHNPNSPGNAADKVELARAMAAFADTKSTQLETELQRDEREGKIIAGAMMLGIGAQVVLFTAAIAHAVITNDPDAEINQNLITPAPYEQTLEQ